MDSQGKPLDHPLRRRGGYPAAGPSAPLGLALGVLVALAACAGPGSSPGARASSGGRPESSAAKASVATAGPRGDAALLAADSLVQNAVATGLVPGAVLWVSRNGETVFEEAYGNRVAYAYGTGQYGRYPEGPVAGAGTGPVVDPSPRRMTVDTGFDLASLTKVLATTMAVMRLLDRGILDLDAPVSRWLSDFEGGGREAITPRLLLTHRSGLPQWLPIYYDADHADAAWDVVRSVPLGWEPGAGHHYSDLGFMTLGRLVEAVSGTSLDVFLERDLYRPLGLTRTGFVREGAAAGGVGPFAATSHGNPYENRMVHDPDFGYEIAGDPARWNGWRRRTLEGEVNDGNAFHAFDGVSGHAGLFSTAAEAGALVELIVGEGVLDGHRWIDAATVRTFLEPTGDAQALGWRVPDGTPPGSFAHTGFTGTWVLGVPARGLAVVLLTNRQHAGVGPDSRYPDLSGLQKAITEALLGPR